MCTHLKAILRWSVSTLLPAEEEKKAKWIAFSCYLGFGLVARLEGFGSSFGMVLRCMVGFADDAFRVRVAGDSIAVL